jgi:DNA modification methylase
MQVTLWPVDRPIQYARNARRIPQSAIDKVAASIKEFGWRQPIVVDAAGVIIAGHTRLLAAQKLGLAEVPVHVAEGLTEGQIKAYRLMDNRSHQEAQWDFELLTPELTDLKALDLDLSLTGFDPKELDALFAKADASQGLTDPDECPAAPEFPVTEPGDLWILGRHRLLCGDSTSIDAVERLMNGEKADMVFTDPPYGVDYDGGHAVKGKRREKLKNDDTPDIYSNVLPLAYTYSKAGAALYLWYSDSKAIAVLSAVLLADYEVRNTIIWNKNLAQFGAIGAQYKCKHEPCLYCFKKGNAPFWAGPNNEVTVWDVARGSKNDFHPTQKPVELSERAMNNSSKAGDVVLDLFGGSGSTLIGCERTARNARLVELNQKYCDVIIKRWQDFTGHDATLDGDGRTFNQIAAQRKPNA